LRTIAIINQKGGCGKTTCAINLAAVLAAMGRRTLLIDMDPQSHCALGLAVPGNQLDRSMADVMRHGMDGAISLSDVIWQIARNLDLAPSTMALAGIEQELTSAPDKDRRLMQVMSTVADRYDFCIIDCPPSIGLITFNALRASDEVLIPVETGYFAMQGAIKQQATLNMLVRRANHRIRSKVLATMYDVRTKLAREILGELKKQFGEQLLPVVVNFNAKLKEAASFGQPITEYDPASRGMQDFEELARWLIANPPEPPEVAEPEIETLAATGTTGVAGNSPAVSRAAELVERARALATRTAQLSARLSGDADVVREVGPAIHQPRIDTHSTLVSTATPAAPPARSTAEKLARLYGVRPTTQGLLFVQPSKPDVRRLQIAADFNSWEPERTPMTRDDSLGVWQCTVQVPPGRYQYRLVVNGQWVQDPYNSYVECNPFGELNNVVEIEDE
jgi:chromosome partitioning protein